MTEDGDRRNLGIYPAGRDSSPLKKEPESNTFLLKILAEKKNRGNTPERPLTRNK